MATNNEFDNCNKLLTSNNAKIKTTTTNTDLTAEWTVHAQFTILRPGSKSDKNVNDDKSLATGKQQQPVQVVYKWSSDDVQQQGEDNNKAVLSSSESPKTPHSSFHSTTSTTGRDSGHNSSVGTLKNPTNCKPQCTSTCSIVLTACADIPSYNSDSDNNEPDKDPVTYNTTATCTVTPTKIKTTPSFRQKDVSCQTSDCEIIFKKKTDKLNPTESNNLRNGNGKRQPKLYDYRRHTDSMLPVQKTVDEESKFTPPRQLSRSPARRLMGNTPATSLSPHSSFKDANKKKPPRTVHIDVYCTGSDLESSDNLSSSPPTPNEEFNFLEGVRSPQTVVDAEDMRLQHRQAGKRELPRRIAGTEGKNLEKKFENPPSRNAVFSPTFNEGQTEMFRTLLKKDDEINESKQMLFNKHLGDQKQIRKFNALKSRMNFRRDVSDDCLSSNYPNSSYSTVRDMTCSSISSALASNSAIFEDLDSSFKESDELFARSDSFEYETANDRFSIRHLAEQWQDDKSFEKQLVDQKRMEEYFHKNISQSSESSERISEDLESEESEGVVRPLNENLKQVPSSKSIDVISASESCPSTVKGYSNDHEDAIVTPVVGRMTFLSATIKTPSAVSGYINQQRMKFSPGPDESDSSTIKSHLSGYTNDHLLRARRFGAVVAALRKPGHHVGPVRNPECSCEHCRSWMESRNPTSGGVGRGRAMSVGSSPLNRVDMWVKNHNKNSSYFQHSNCV